MRETIGKFRIIREIGHGAMGTVYLGEDDSIGRQVAIKTIRGDSALGAESKTRFFREARACGTLNHPNIVTVYDFGEEADLLYLAMEYIPGEDLQTTFQAGLSSPQELLALFGQICDGLQHAHERGVIHRDIKPSNIRVTRTARGMTAKIVDFGVARTANSDLTNSGIIMGTVSYLAPEYINSGEASHLSDIFSLGVMAYEGLTRRKPFCGNSSATVLLQILSAPAPLLTMEEMKGLNPAIQGVLQKALAKKPEERFKNAEALGEAFRKAMNPEWNGALGEDLATFSRNEKETEPLSAQRMVRGKPRRSLWFVGIGAILLAAVAGITRYKTLHTIPEQAPKQADLLPPVSTAVENKTSVANTPNSAVRTKSNSSSPDLLDIRKIGESVLKEPPTLALDKIKNLTREYPDQPSIYAIYIIVLIKNQKYNDVERVQAEAGTHGISLDQMKKAYPQLGEALSILEKSSDLVKEQCEAALGGDPIQAVETVRALSKKYPDHQAVQAMYLISLARTRKTAEFDQARANLKAKGMSLDVLKRVYPPLVQALEIPNSRL